VQEALTKTFSGEKRWDPERGDLLSWLRWVVRGDVDRLYHSKSHPPEGVYDVELESFEMDEDDELALDKAEHRAGEFLPDGHIGTPPEDVTIAIETEEEKAILTKLKIDALLESCNGRNDLEDIVYAINDDKCLPKTQSLTKYLGRSEKESNQQLRALRRRAAKILTTREWTKNG